MLLYKSPLHLVFFVFIFSAWGMLSGCVFVPVYAPEGTHIEIREKIKPVDPVNKNDFNFTERFENRLGVAAVPVYMLEYHITTKSKNLYIALDNGLTRFQVVGDVTWSLIRIKDGVVVESGRTSSFSGFSTLQYSIGEILSEDDASFRLMTILADQVVSQIIAVSGRWNDT